MFSKLKNIIEKPKEGSPIWMTVYSDMMTNLMLFFLMLFGLTQQGGQQAMNAAAQEFAEQMDEGVTEKIKEQEKIEENMEERLKGMEDENVQVKIEADAVRIIFSAPVLFDSGSSSLKTYAEELMHELAVNLANTTNKFVIEGHTDNIPIVRGAYKSNWDLSAARAESFIRYLVHKEGYLPKQFSIAAYGEYLPVASNATEEGRQKNRRIELVMITKE